MSACIRHCSFSSGPARRSRLQPPSTGFFQEVYERFTTEGSAAQGCLTDSLSQGLLVDGSSQHLNPPASIVLRLPGLQIEHWPGARIGGGPGQIKPGEIGPAMLGSTGPTIVRGVGNQSGPHGIAFDVCHRLPGVGTVQRTGKEARLPDVPAGSSNDIEVFGEIGVGPAEGGG